MDGMTPIDLLGIPMQDYVDLRFHHADLEGSQIDGFIWDVGDGEDAYALYENEKLPLLDDPGLKPLAGAGSGLRRHPGRGDPPARAGGSGTAAWRPSIRRSRRSASRLRTRRAGTG